MDNHRIPFHTFETTGRANIKGMFNLWKTRTPHWKRDINTNTMAPEAETLEEAEEQPNARETENGNY